MNNFEGRLPRSRAALRAAARRTTAGCGTALLLAAPALAQDRTADVDRVFSQVTPETPGCAVGVAQVGKVLVNRAYGLADFEKQVPLTPGTAFDIGSTHKQFVAAAVLLLVEEGRLALTDDVRKYLPELPRYEHTLTVDHLLTHTSGIRDWTGLLPLAPEGTDVLELIMRQRALNFEPGAEWSYSNSGYVLLKEIVARASGMSFAEFARRRIFEPLGMSSSSYVADIMQGEGQRAIGYEREGDGWKQYMRLGNERGGGTVISNARDLLTWNEALTGGRLGAFVTAKLHEPARLDNGRELTYARGLMLDQEIPGGPMIWHSGGAAGYSTWLGRFLENGLSVAVLCNFEPVSATNLAGAVADLFLPAADPRSKRAGPTPAPGVDVTGRAGLYFSESGEPLRLVVNAGRLGIVGGPPLVPVSAERFLPPRSMLFFRSQDRFELTFLSDGGFELQSMEGEKTRWRRAEPWTPSAADLAAYDGRYGSEELGTVFEIVPGASGVVMRFEEAPEKAQEGEPVARDTFMRGRAILRFRRDAGGAVTGFEYGNPVIRGITFTRLGDRKPGTPPAAAAPGAAGGTRAELPRAGTGE